MKIKRRTKAMRSIAFVRLLIFLTYIVDHNKGEVENFTKQGMGGRNNQATSLGTTSVGVEQKSEVIKTSDHSRQAKKRDKRTGDVDKDSQLSCSSNRSSGRSKRQTQFFGSPLKHSVENLKDKSGKEKLKTIPISPGDIPSSLGNTP